MIAQAIGFAGVFFGFYISSLKDKNKIFLYSFIKSMILVLHYLILGTSDLAIAIGGFYAFQNLTAYLVEQQRPWANKLFWANYPLLILIFAFFFRKFSVDLFVAITLALDLIARKQKHINQYRVYTIAAYISWLVFCYFIASYSGIFSSLVNIGILVFMVKREKAIQAESLVP